MPLFCATAVAFFGDISSSLADLASSGYSPGFVWRSQPLSGHGWDFGCHEELAAWLFMMINWRLRMASPCRNTAHNGEESTITNQRLAVENWACWLASMPHLDRENSLAFEESNQPCSGNQHAPLHHGPNDNWPPWTVIDHSWQSLTVAINYHHGLSQAISVTAQPAWADINHHQSIGHC